MVTSVTVKDSTGATQTVNTLPALGQTTGANSLPVVVASDQGAVPTTGTAGTAGDAAITTGGTAQTLFGGATPTNGFSVSNPDQSNDLWISDSATASPNGQGSIRVVANGGYYETPPRYKPVGAVSVYGATTGQKITAREW